MISSPVQASATTTKTTVDLDSSAPQLSDTPKPAISALDSGSAAELNTQLESLTVSDEPNQQQPKVAPRSPPKPKIKKRKSQSEEDYQAQKLQYETTGPIIQTPTSLLERDYSNAVDKIDRQAFRNAVERAYYLRDYEKAIQLLNSSEQGNASIGPRERQELDILKESCLKAMATSKQ